MVPIPGTETTTVRTVWHHTNAAGLLGIIEKQELWASSPIAMNDQAEVVYGVSILRNVWSQMSGSVEDNEVRGFVDALLETLETRLISSVYMVCATKTKDSLNNWMHYSRNQGYAVGLSTALGYRPADWHGSRGIMFPVSIGWHDVEYDADEQARMAKRSLDYALDALTHPRARANLEAMEYEEIIVDLLSALSVTVLKLKHPAFEPEQEVRLLVPLHPSEHEKFRAGDRGVIPYVTVTYNNDFDDHSGGKSKPSTWRMRLPIDVVYCGPNNSDDSGPASETVKRLLQVNDLEGTEVRLSQVPYRF